MTNYLIVAPLLAAVGVGIGLVARRHGRDSFANAVLIAVAFGASIALIRPGFVFVWVGLGVVGVGSERAAVGRRLESSVLVVLGCLISLATVAQEVSPSVTIPGAALLALLAWGLADRDPAPHATLLAGCLALSHFGLFAALPDTEAAVAFGSLTFGLTVALFDNRFAIPSPIAVTTILLAAMWGSARDIETLLGSLPTLGVFAVLSCPGLGRRLEAKLSTSTAIRWVALGAHLALCGLPRWIIVGRP